MNLRKTNMPSRARLLPIRERSEMNCWSNPSSSIFRSELAGLVSGVGRSHEPDGFTVRRIPEYVKIPFLKRIAVSSYGINQVVACLEAPELEQQVASDQHREQDSGAKYETQICSGLVRSRFHR